ncbi:hypothetical protein CAPTEDRAFT_226684 [Capitella teleta]|uniref:C-type lectin domain-containing protein n=1 Tax=Capitella teleta TaxID=283909 RepID=R7TVK7_CAPTE|nr:hypothetical protein CAPTEDRAFT_226684 [Capitella teleta]|eukprot:ELT97749.1 hypothetical protein CAPTEDRAFT_226684 [Capitella teleta]
MDNLRGVLSWGTIMLLAGPVSLENIDLSRCDAWQKRGPEFGPNVVACYHIMQGLYNFQNATLKCRSFDMEVLVVTSQQDNDVITTLMKEYNDVWLGAYEDVAMWRWIDGTAISKQGCVNFDTTSAFELVYSGLNNSVPYCSSVCTASGGSVSIWNRNQPNNHLGYQTCAVMDKSYDFWLNDVACMESHGVICEIRDQLSKLTRAECLGIGGDLAVLADEETRLAMKVFLIEMNSTTSGFWVGLLRGRWRWQSGHEFGFTRWQNDQPNSGIENCATLVLDAGDKATKFILIGVGGALFLVLVLVAAVCCICKCRCCKDEVHSKDIKRTEGVEEDDEGYERLHFGIDVGVGAENYATETVKEIESLNEEERRKSGDPPDVIPKESTEDAVAVETAVMEN